MKTLYCGMARGVFWSSDFVHRERGAMNHGCECRAEGIVYMHVTSYCLHHCGCFARGVISVVHVRFSIPAMYGKVAFGLRLCMVNT